MVGLFRISHDFVFFFFLFNKYLYLSRTCTRPENIEILVSIEYHSTEIQRNIIYVNRITLAAY